MMSAGEPEASTVGARVAWAADGSAGGLDRGRHLLDRGVQRRRPRRIGRLLAWPASLVGWGLPVRRDKGSGGTTRVQIDAGGLAPPATRRYSFLMNVNFPPASSTAHLI